MKTITAWMLTLWIALVVEHVNSSQFPTGSLLLPLAVGCLFWLRNGTGSLLAGTAMIAHWILHPTFAPVAAVVTLLLSAMFITRGSRQNAWTPMTTRRHHHSWWLQPLFVLLAGLVCQTMTTSEFTSADMLPELATRLLIATPCLVIVLLTVRAADEFGLRRRLTA